MTCNWPALHKTWLLPLDPYLIQNIQQVPPGDSLVLTIDRDIQASVETILDKALVDTKAQSGTIVVEDPKTGEILAMALLAAHGSQQVLRLI